MSGTTPFLSIITINRNNAQGLKTTMHSVFDQLSCETDFEYIIIDGASTDNSIDVIKDFLNIPEYASHISFWCSENDTGLYNALNKGIQHSKGDLIGLMHSGDWYLPNTFQGIKQIYSSSPDSILYGALKAVSNNRFESIWGHNADILPKEMIPHLSTFVPRIIYDKFGVFDESYRIAADYDLFLRFYTSHVNFVFIDKIICCFNLEGISQTNNNTELETIAIKEKYGFYIPPTKKTKIKKIIKKIIKW